MIAMARTRKLAAASRIRGRSLVREGSIVSVAIAMEALNRAAAAAFFISLVEGAVGAYARGHKRSACAPGGNAVQYIRISLGVTIAAFLSLASTANLAALDYPNRPVHWIVAYPAGGSTDIVA